MNTCVMDCTKSTIVEGKTRWSDMLLARVPVVGVWRLVRELTEQLEQGEAVCQVVLSGAMSPYLEDGEPLPNMNGVQLDCAAATEEKTAVLVKVSQGEAWDMLSSFVQYLRRVSLTPRGDDSDGYLPLPLFGELKEVVVAPQAKSS